MKTEIRTLKRRLEVLKKQPPKALKGGPEGDRLLKQANEHIEVRKKESARNIYDMSYEAAGDLLNLGKGRVAVYGGIGSGYRLGTGRWKFTNGKWLKGG